MFLKIKMFVYTLYSNYKYRKWFQKIVQSKMVKSHYWFILAIMWETKVIYLYWANLKVNILLFVVVGARAVIVIWFAKVEVYKGSLLTYGCTNSTSFKSWSGRDGNIVLNIVISLFDQIKQISAWYAILLKMYFLLTKTLDTFYGFLFKN